MAPARTICIPLPIAAVVLLALSLPAAGQSDPGVRSGPINGQSGSTATSPQPLASVGANSPQGSLEFFQNGLTRFQEVESVANGANNGLGPRFNLNSCSGCHAQPSVGGSSPASNPQYAAYYNGTVSQITNTLPVFITANGPVREARFPFFFNAQGQPNTGSPNGGVETLFTVSGRPDAGSCTLIQPAFAAAEATNNVIYRIPTPVFGAGLVENIDDSTLLANHAAQARNNFGVAGTFNYNGNDGTIARFGWKAQNKSLELFAGEAYNVEMGITNEIFPTERPVPEEEHQGNGLPSNCLNLSGGGYPEDATNFAATQSSDTFSENASIPSDTVSFSMFMRLLAPPVPSATVPGGSAAISAGLSAFRAIGCSACHTPTLSRTQASHITSSLSGASVSAYSDFEIHHMGTGLADNVAQGGAGGDQFRTAPLWGIGQRIFFLHDGRTNNLISAILAHASSGSEASQVVQNYQNLPAATQQDLLDFLRSL